MFCEFSEDASNTDEKAETFNLDFYILDQPNSKTGRRTNTQEILSDTKLIANDLIAYLRYTEFDAGLLKIDLPVSMKDRIGVTDDDVTGWSFTLNIKVNNELDLCGVLTSCYQVPSGYVQKSGNTLQLNENAVYNTFESPETIALSYITNDATEGVEAIVLHSEYVGAELALFAILTSGTYNPLAINKLTFTYDGVNVNYTIEQITC